MPHQPPPVIAFIFSASSSYAFIILARKNAFSFPVAPAILSQSKPRWT
nr:MAG TPA_asm: hypothetical protein [Caudoviricetes sp.]